LHLKMYDTVGGYKLEHQYVAAKDRCKSTEDVWVLKSTDWKMNNGPSRRGGKCKTDFYRASAY